MAKEKVWGGSQILDCELCHKPIVNTFVDGKTHCGPWAIMCPACHTLRGCGVGTGRGQEYVKRGDTFGKTKG